MGNLPGASMRGHPPHGQSRAGTRVATRPDASAAPQQSGAIDRHSPASSAEFFTRGSRRAAWRAGNLAERASQAPDGARTGGPCEVDLAGAGRTTGRSPRDSRQGLSRCPSRLNPSSASQRGPGGLTAMLRRCRTPSSSRRPRPALPQRLEAAVGQCDADARATGS